MARHRIAERAPTRVEWDQILTSARSDTALDETVESGVLYDVFPELYRLVGFGGERSGHKDLWAHTKIVVRQTLPRSLLRWAALFHDCGKPECFAQIGEEITFRHHEEVSAQLFLTAAERSKLFQASEIKRIAAIILLLGRVEQYSSEWSDSAVRRLGRELGELAEDVLAVARADCSSKNSVRRRAIQAKCHSLKTRLADIAKKDATPRALPHGLGTVVMERLGIPAGKMTRDQALEMKRVMSALEAMVENGQLPRAAELDVYLTALTVLLNSQ